MCSAQTGRGAGFSPVSVFAVTGAIPPVFHTPVSSRTGTIVPLRVTVPRDSVSPPSRPSNKKNYKHSILMHILLFLLISVMVMTLHDP